MLGSIPGPCNVHGVPCFPLGCQSVPNGRANPVVLILASPYWPRCPSVPLRRRVQVRVILSLLTRQKARPGTKITDSNLHAQLGRAAFPPPREPFPLRTGAACCAIRVVAFRGGALRTRESAQRAPVVRCRQILVSATQTPSRPVAPGPPVASRPGLVPLPGRYVVQAVGAPGPYGVQTRLPRLRRQRRDQNINRRSDHLPR